MEGLKFFWRGPTPAEREAENKKKEEEEKKKKKKKIFAFLPW